MRSARPMLLLLGALLVPQAASAQSATTTRIETRPFYGATVTLEAGVRVYRPLPPHQRVIINPGGATPLSLGFEERAPTVHNHYYGAGASGFAGDGYGAGGYVPYARGERYGRAHGPRAGALRPDGGPVVGPVQHGRGSGAR